MKVYKGTTPVKIYNGNHKMPKIYKGDTLLCSDTYNYHYRVPNLISNGDFIDTTGWLGTGATISVVSNTLSVMGTGATQYPAAYQQLAIPTIDNKYALAFCLRALDAACKSLFYRYGMSAAAAFVTNPVVGQWYTGVVIITCDNAYRNISFFHGYLNAATANGKVMEVQYVSCVDLTALEADLGIEITQENYEDWISKLPNQYIDRFQMW
jgi:hypothetical protein